MQRYHLTTILGCGLATMACAPETLDALQAHEPALTAGATFVQGAAAVPQAPQITVALAFPQAQGAAHLNVAFVGWNDTVANVTSVTDARGNVYQRAIG